MPPAASPSLAIDNWRRVVSGRDGLAVDRSSSQYPFRVLVMLMKIMFITVTGGLS
jgi:hypothetical protein